MVQRSLAWSLTWLFTAVVVYASLYPFIGWRVPVVPWWAFVTASWPKYWTVFDTVSNVLGYIPLGFLMMLGMIRMPQYHAYRWWVAVFPCVLSFSLESLQAFLPARVSSNVDWGLNTTGAWMGALFALRLHRYGVFRQWSEVRRNWFTVDAYSALILLGLWPLAVLYPTPVPFGLGQINPLLNDIWYWVWGIWPWSKHSFPEPSPLSISPLAVEVEVAIVGLGVLLPVLLGYQVLRQQAYRKWWLTAVLMGGCVLASVSSLMTYGPPHFGAWWTLSVACGLIAALVLGSMAIVLSRRMLQWGVLIVLLISLYLLNTSGQPPYLHESLEVWAQGRFIRFHGATQWLGWLWPYAVFLHALKNILYQPLCSKA